jgi:HPr kinase/phosphorylase
VDLPLVRMPVAPGRNLAILIEVASRNQLLKLRGFHGARAFVDRVAAEIERGAVSSAESNLDPDGTNEEPPAV